jgi:hypothetical protein
LCLERKEDSPTHFAAQLKAENKTKKVREPFFHPHFFDIIYKKVTNCKRTVEEGGGGSGGYNGYVSAAITSFFFFFFFFFDCKVFGSCC